jgi:O-antigen/teichoic acid export membrane protein
VSEPRDPSDDVGGPTEGAPGATAAGASGPPKRAVAGAGAEEARHFRGSTILLFGRFIGIALDLATQIIIIRALTRSDFGAFAFGLTVASMASTVALLGLDKTISRFVPIYEETGDPRRLAGSMVLAFGTVAGVCAAMLLILIGLQATVGDKLIENELARRMVLILFLLTPVRAFDSLMTSCFTIFASPRAIVIRRNILGPGLQLLVVIAVAATDGGPEILAVGYVVAGILGIGLFGVLLFRLFEKHGILDRIRRREVTLPVRALFGFSLPLLSSDIVYLLRTSMVIILLQGIATSTEVAAFAAVLPLARQNMLIYQTFAFLFVPVAARLFARGENSRLREMYWQTSAWIAVATFPALAVSVALAEPLTTLLFTNAYADSAAVLAILALGHYFSAALGFNALTLRVQGSVRFIVAVDVLSTVVSLGTSLILIRSFGALGAAIGTTATMVVQNLLYQAGLVRSPVGLPGARHLAAFASVIIAITGLTALQLALHPPFIIGLLVSAVVSLALVGINRGTLQIGLYFPELMRIPIVRRLFGAAPSTGEPDAA